MASAIQTNFRVRQSYDKVARVIELPNLIDIQMNSYEKFLQANIEQSERGESGLQGVFRSVFPIRDFNGTSELVFVSYQLERPKYDVNECRQRGMTFAAPIRVTIQLIEGRTDSHVWAKSFDRELSDILALHSEVARAVDRKSVV